MLVRDWMTASPLTAPFEMGVFQARQLMQERRVRHLPVIHDGKLVGMVTDRDIRLNLPSPATSLSVWEVNYLLAHLTVGEIMTKVVITVGAQRDVVAAARLMLDHKIGALAVTDEGSFVGIITETDLLRAFLHTQESAATPAVDTARR
jgi:acetoin utilization protein AcuB